MLHVKKLRVFGTSIGVANELLEACGGIRNLDVLEQDMWGQEERAFGVPLLDNDVCDSESESESESNGETEEEEGREEIFYDCYTDIEERSWSSYEGVLESSFTKEELSRMLSAFQRQLAIVV
ncbi:hypothetical protein L218DRAFT_996418 [Marasmius fiardii PR-910]|nr:hypothetical protein L218DRAFT_996418 [Marasmius fiardii PR-910]